ncbi:MAG: transcription-repair coupling factor [Sorangiineae bacterium]|nr:transcription-repair coupling factor [Polyangiaceae bacterium]MEB2322637.1 transcription-repair coupling factor [Sorangiineae bacterium]
MDEREDVVDDVSSALTLPTDRRIVTAAEAAALAREPGEVVHVVGAEGAAPALLARAIARAGRRVLYLTADADGARRAAADLASLSRALPLPSPNGEPLADGEPLLLASPETSPYAEVHPDRRLAMTRTATLARLASGAPWRFVVTTIAGLARRVAPMEAMRAATVHVRVEEELDVERTAEALASAGYLRVPVVEDPGSFAVRGGLIDVWPPEAPLPSRIELYGDLVASIRSFDPEDQRTRDDAREVWLYPARDAVGGAPARERAEKTMRALCDAVDLPSSQARALVEDVVGGRAFFGADGFLPAFYELVPVSSYLPGDLAVVVEDPVAVLRALDAELEHGRADAAARAGKPHFPVSALYLDRDELAEALGHVRVFAAHRAGVAGEPDEPRALSALEMAPLDAPTLAARDQGDLGRAIKAARVAHGKQGALAPLVRRVEAWREAGLHIVLVARVGTQAERLASLLGHRGVSVVTHLSGERTPSPIAGTVHVVVGPLARGVVAPAEGFALVTEEEIFGQRTHRATGKKRSARAVLEDLRALAPGDFVVHVDHGVGRYLGLERRMVGGVGVELLAVEYTGGDKLYLPVHRLNQIQKYSGADGAPKLDRLGGQSFAKTKAKVQKRVRQMADELLRLYAERNALAKEPLPPPDDDYATFEATFPFEETRDQLDAINDVRADMESPRVMDRLVCGDVGFGKTEVALRAAFLAAMHGRQVALLCPTTVLAQQHYNNFTARLADYPLTVRALSRFQSKAEQLETLKGLKGGAVDVVVGTHRLLSKDVQFKRLGLLIVDEEQRFGVSHKERIKQIRASVDALTLSATPIPRTLQLAVGGLRDMSLITTAPVDRRAIRTITSRFDEALVREAVERELGRGGQVFYVYNRVEGIYERAARLQALLPNARIAVGHGQLSEAVLERTMLDFVAGQYDILVATAIIESGLDIPRANTIIIDRADLFGLAQLYQLRGRVGRSSERAYCYLLVPPPSKLSDEARMRIEALERHTELGSGFQVATLDMEIRGAGDLLGAEQSGFVASVGFDLFCRMLEEATHELRGEPVVHEVDPDLALDVDALLPEDYVADVGVRLSLYKRLSGADGDAEVAEVAAELEDRFGPPPTEARHLIELMRLKTELRRLRVLGMDASKKSVTLNLREDTPLDPVKVGALVAARSAGYKLTPDGRLTRRAREDESFKHGLALADRMLDELSRCLRAP